MARISAVSLAGLVSACVTGAGPAVSTGGPGEIRSIALGGGVHLTLPVVPGYPKADQFTQLLSTKLGGETRRVQAELSLSPNHVTAFFSPPGAPPVLQIDWSASGITTRELSPLDVEMDGQRVLADIYLTHWPLAALLENLDGGTATERENTRKIANVRGEPVVTIRTEGAGDRTRITLRNDTQGYALTILSRRPLAHAAGPSEP